MRGTQNFTIAYADGGSIVNSMDQGAVSNFTLQKGCASRANIQVPCKEDWSLKRARVILGWQTLSNNNNNNKIA